MNSSSEIQNAEIFQSDEELVAKAQQARQIEMQNLQSNISQLENEIKKMEEEKNKYEGQLDSLKSQINQSAIIQELEEEKKKLQMLQAKIEYIRNKIQNKIQNPDKNQEQEIATDSIYLQTLLKQKDARVKTIRDKIDSLKPISNVEINLQKLYDDLETSKKKLQILKETSFGNKESNYEETYQRMTRKLQELKLKQEKMEAIKEQIKEVNKSLNKEKDKQLTLKCKLKLVDTIYLHYVNQCEQQKTIISNLQNEIQPYENNVY